MDEVDKMAAVLLAQVFTPTADGRASRSDALGTRDQTGEVFALIEWDGAPLLIGGLSVDAVQREAVRIFADDSDGNGSLADAEPVFCSAYPFPDTEDPCADIAGWLAAMNTCVTSACFTIFDDWVDLR
jgi:hypothetical protein